MSEEIDKKLYAHYKGLIDGSYHSNNPIRNQLVLDDAKKHLADLIKKRPNTIFEEPKLVEEPEIKQHKSKGKK